MSCLKEFLGDSFHQMNCEISCKPNLLTNSELPAKFGQEPSEILVRNLASCNISLEDFRIPLRTRETSSCLLSLFIWSESTSQGRTLLQEWTMTRNCRVIVLMNEKKKSGVARARVKIAK